MRFSDPKAPQTGMTSMSFGITRRSALMTQLIPTLTESNSSGVWTAPFMYFDSDVGNNLPLMAYMLPLSFNTAGACTSAIIIEISLLYVPRLLTKFTVSGSEMHLVDLNAAVYLGSSYQYYTTDVYGYVSTPNDTINTWIQEGLNRGGATATSGISFALDSAQLIVNFARVDTTRWGIMEVLTVDAALNKFYPIPSVTSASEALAMMNTSTNLKLFCVVLMIIMLFTLNLFILGCSTVGATVAASPPPATAAAAAAPLPPAVENAAAALPLCVISEP